MLQILLFLILFLLLIFVVLFILKKHKSVDLSSEPCHCNNCKQTFNFVDYHYCPVCGKHLDYHSEYVDLIFSKYQDIVEFRQLISLNENEK